MKIRMRHNHQQMAEADRTLFDGWISKGSLDGTYVLHNPPDWEPVPPEKTWQPASCGVWGPQFIIEGPAPADVRMYLPPWLRVVRLDDGVVKFEVLR